MAYNPFGIDTETQEALDQAQRTPIPVEQPVQKPKRGFGQFMEDLLGATVFGQAARSVRSRREISEALKSYATDPLAAVRQLAASGYGQEAMTVMDSLNTQNREMLKARASAAKDYTAAEESQIDTWMKKVKPLASLASPALSKDFDESTWGKHYNVLSKIAGDKGIDLASYGITPQFDREAINQFVAQAVDREKALEIEELKKWRTAQTILRGGELVQEGLRNEETNRSNRQDEATAASRAADYSRSVDTQAERTSKMRDRSRGSAGGKPQIDVERGLVREPSGRVRKATPEELAKYRK